MWQQLEDDPHIADGADRVYRKAKIHEQAQHSRSVEGDKQRVENEEWRNRDGYEVRPPDSFVERRVDQRRLEAKNGL